MPTARLMWTLYEPIHAVTYFAPEALAAFEEAGLRGFWRGYFAGRAAPLGAVGSAPVVASFFGFAPAMVARAVPSVWSLVTPEQALDARATGALAALRRVLGEADPRAIAEAAELLGRTIDDLDCAGRMLGAANVALPGPAEPLLQLWHAATVLREHRGDGHIAAWVAMGMTGREAILWRACLDLGQERLQPSRGWTDEQWRSGLAGLTERGWLTEDGTPTEHGGAAYAAIEEATDLAAAAPWRRLSSAELATLAELLHPLASACGAALPYPNPIGLPQPQQLPQQLPQRHGS